MTQQSSDPGFWVELKYDVQLLLFEEAGRSVTGPVTEKNGVKVLLMQDWDGCTVVTMRLPSIFVWRALGDALALSYDVLFDLMDIDPDTEDPEVPDPISVLVQDTEGLRLARRSPAEREAGA